LHLHVEALDVLKRGNYERSIELTRQVEELYEAAGSTHIAARAWKEVGAALVEAQEPEKAQEAFSRAFNLYRSINDAEGQASTLLLLGEASQVHDITSALEIFERARIIADSCNADLIGLKSRAALWRLSGGSDEARRRRYWRELVVASCSLKSNITRSEALTLYKAEVPGALVNNLWSFHEGFFSTRDMRFECLLSSRLLATHHGQDVVAFKSWIDDVTKPWEGLLAVFTSAMLTQILLSLSQYILQMKITDVQFKVSTHRDKEKESFFLSFAGDEPHLLRETINRYVTDDADFRYYEELARTIGASLVGRINRRDFIEMEMPLDLMR
jgi:tetratricopeptide (TPR) repeat protein